MNTESMKKELMKFEKLSIEHAHELYLPGSSKANAKNRAIMKLVDKWSVTADAPAMLRQLLGHEKSAVRLMAAAHLVKFNNDPDAVSVLRDFVKNDPSLLAVSAGGILRVYKISATP